MPPRGSCPVLQPALMKTGITSSRKLSGRLDGRLRDLHRHVTVLPPNATAKVVAPSATG